MNAKILLVDDEPEVLEALRLALSHAKGAPDVVTAASGPEALERLREGPFAMVIADYRMPEMDGVELLSRIRDSAPDTVRGLLTGFHDLDIALAAADRAGVHYYLQKPWDNEEIRTVVREAVDGAWKRGVGSS